MCLYMNKQRIYKVLAVILVVGLLASGSVLGFVFGYSRGINSQQAMWRSGEWGKLNDALYHIENFYINESDREQLLEGALRGLVDSLEDPYSSYLNAEEMEEMEISSGGSYSGIGVEVTMEDNRITILAPFRGSPAEDAGLMPGDKIVEVDGRNLEGMNLDDAIKYIRGEAGTELTLGIIREGRANIFHVTLTRAEIHRSSVEYQMLTNDIGYLNLTRFADGSTEEFAQAVTDLRSQGMDGLILDLRGNPGGYLDVAINIARQVVPEGLIVYTKDRDGERTSEFRSNLRERGYPMVLLVDELSASASEILAGALKDSDGAVLVGANTYGKGTIQRYYELGDGSVVKLTMSRFYTPNGLRIDGNGVAPDYEVELEAAARLPHLPFLGTIEPGDDKLNVVQLQMMLEALDYYQGEATGYYDEATVAAVRAFQNANNLSASGLVDRQTTERLNQRWETYSRDADTQLAKARELIQDLIRQEN